MKGNTRVKRKKRQEIRKEEIAEDWCFVCKDGGSLRVCDYKQCLKAYHPECVEKDESFLRSKRNWACGCHSCFNCNKISKYHCFCCPKGVCERCADSNEFAYIKGDKGFCHICVKLALLGEEGKTVDSNGKILDFTNRETPECLFLEYWVIIKEEENLTSEDLQSANTILKNWKKSISSGSVLVESSESDSISNYCTDEEKQEGKSPKVMKRSKVEASGSKSKTTKQDKKFIDWGSEALIEFLTSIGKQTTNKLSQYEVTSIVTRYISDNNLCSLEKKKKVLCDARLKSLFRKKILNKNKIYDLLEFHLSENIVVEDEIWSNSPDVDDDDGLTASTKKKRTLSKFKESTETEKVQEEGPKSCFASIVEENIKLIYLMKSLVKQMLDNNESEVFDTKVIGCFVKIRSDPMDHLQKNRFQLVLITGVKRILEDDKMKVNLQASTGKVNIDLDVEKLVDGRFNKEELDDLRNRVEDGSIPRPTVVDLDLKARSLHVEITNHAIEKELRHLANLIDHCNEKGWRVEFFEHLERRELLESPEEQRRMLETVPQAIAAPAELDIESLTLNNQACETLGLKEENVSTPFVNEEMPAANEPEAANVGENNEPEAANVGENNETETIYSDSEEDDHWRW